MKNEILDKLQKEVSLPVKAERQVVYILSLIRKLFEHKHIKSKPFELLRLYCDWVLHIGLDKKGAKKVLESFGEKTCINDPKIKIFTFEGLRSELSSFLKRLNMSQELVNENWFRFRKNLLDVIIDCPLYNPGASTKEFSFVKTPGFSDWTGKYSINYREIRVITHKEEVREGGILLGDQDEETKSEMAQQRNRFALRLHAKMLVRSKNHVQ